MPRVIQRAAEKAHDIVDGDQVSTIDVMQLGPEEPPGRWSNGARAVTTAPPQWPHLNCASLR